QVYYSNERIKQLKRCLDDMLDTATAPGGVHPKMAKVLDKVFTQIEKVGGDIGANKRRRTMPRTWKDSNANTLFLD
ncbi:hypothetical protein C8J56DRAFT_1081956, partial [Mycena floridula]